MTLWGYCVPKAWPFYALGIKRRRKEKGLGVRFHAQPRILCAVIDPDFYAAVSKGPRWGGFAGNGRDLT